MRFQLINYAEFPTKNDAVFIGEQKNIIKQKSKNRVLNWAKNKRKLATLNNP